jgi:hypothetical protein
MCCGAAPSRVSARARAGWARLASCVAVCGRDPPAGWLTNGARRLARAAGWRVFRAARWAGAAGREWRRRRAGAQQR